MPSGNSPTQSRMVNTIYWAKDDPPGRDRTTGRRFRPGPWAEGICS